MNFDCRARCFAALGRGTQEPGSKSSDGDSNASHIVHGVGILHRPVNHQVFVRLCEGVCIKRN